MPLIAGFGMLIHTKSRRTKISNFECSFCREQKFVTEANLLLQIGFYFWLCWLGV